MGIGLVVIVVIAAGLPLLALAVVRRLPPPRLRPARPDPVYEWSRRHRLDARDQARIEQAVRSGQRVQPESLVPAAREYAELVLNRTRRRRPLSGRARTVRLVVLVLYLTGYLVALVFCLQRFPGAIGGFAGGLVSLLFTNVNTRRARRALEANRDDECVTGNGACESDLPSSLT